MTKAEELHKEFLKLFVEVNKKQQRMRELLQEMEDITKSKEVGRNERTLQKM